MVPSPAKRRKRSPTTASAIPVSMPSTPSRIPVPRDGAKSVLGRPSFASPTKASIAKHNPQLLERPRSAGSDAIKPLGKENTIFTGRVPLASVSPENGKENGMAVETSQTTALSSQDRLGATTPTTFPATVGGETRPAEHGLSAQPRRSLRTPNKENIREQEPLKSKPVVPTVMQGEDHVKLSEMAPSSRPAEVLGSLTGPETGSSILPNPFRKTGLRRSPITSRPIETRLEPVTVEREPELPLTPTQRGLVDPVVTTPPSGIHNTPSKSSKSRLRTAKSIPSPLKPRPESKAEPTVEKSVKKRKLETSEPNRIFTYDPYAEKKKLLDQLREEARLLEADIALAARENERMRQESRSRKSVVAETPNPAEILDLLTRSTASVASPTPVKKPTLLQSINSLLPFAKRRRPPPPLIQQGISPANHLPLALADPLPQLTLFTPLSFTSDIFILPPNPSSTASDDIFQAHTINARAISGLLTARYSMVVNTTTFAISSLRVEKLDSFADPELGTWMRERANANVVLGRDVNAICWATGRWFEVAMKRAKFWLTLETELGTEEARQKSASRFEKSGNRVDDVETATKSRKWTKRQLLPHMGRREALLSNSQVEFRVEWKIEFDWTGEAESVISANATVPLSWREADSRNSLAKVPETFETLVKSRGPLAAARVLVALLMKE